MKSAFGCIGGTIIYVIAVILNGWVLSILWGWFIVPTFNAPTLGIAPAIGVAMVIGFLTNKGSRQTYAMDKREFWEKIFVELFVSLLLPFTTLGIGWIVKMFM